MKRTLNGSFFLALFVLLVLFSCKQKSKETGIHTEETKYTCPMHPQVIKDQPGSCPICGMDLVPMHSKNTHAGANDSLASLVKPTDELVISGISTVKPQTGSRFEQNEVKGVINYNTNNQNSISARISGRIERLYVKYNYQAVSKGQKLLDIYSPDLANAQQELLFLKSNNEPVLLEAAKRKLRLLGATNQQVNKVLKTGKIDYTISIYSPYSGYVSEIQIPSSSISGGSAAGSTMITSQSSGSSSSMAGSSSMGSPGSSSTGGTSTPSLPDVASNSPLQLREGQYVSAGQRLFNVVNSNSVWAEFYINPADLNNYKKGTIVQVQSVDVNSKRDRVPISLIQPFYKEGTNYSLVRATLSNPNQIWKIGELISVSSESTRRMGTWLPRTAVLQLGTRYISFIRKNGTFSPVYVKAGSVTGEWIDVGNSIHPDQEVAKNAWFLVDSESFIKVKEVTAH